MPLSAEYYILDALRNLDELSIPGIGSFRRKYIPATLDSVHNILKSPSECIEFSAEIETRGLSNFKKYLKSQDEKSSISELLNSIEAEVGRILHANGKFKIQHVGHIYSRNGNIEVEWEANIHEKIFSNLHGFKEIQLPQKSTSELTSAHTFPAASIPVKPELQEKDKQEEGAPLPDAQAIGATLDPAPIPTEGPAHKALHTKGRTSGKKRKFPVLLILLLIILLAIPMAVIYMYPNIFSSKEVATEQIMPLPENPAVVAEQTPKPAPTTESTESAAPAPTPTPAPAPTTTPTPASRAASSANAPAQSAVSQGYHLIVVSSKSEAEAQRVATEWKNQGYETQVIASDGATSYYRVSVLHSTQRSALVNEMIKLKDVTYSWILESAQ